MNNLKIRVLYVHPDKKKAEEAENRIVNKYGDGLLSHGPIIYKKKLIMGYAVSVFEKRYKEYYTRERKNLNNTTTKSK